MKRYIVVKQMQRPHYIHREQATPLWLKSTRYGTIQYNSSFFVHERGLK